MKIHRVATIVSLLSFSALSSFAFGQTRTEACQNGDIGVINGTFDCSTSPDGGGWQYAAPLDEEANGFLAEIVAPSESGRSSNVLKITNVGVDGTLLPTEKMVWQDGITLGNRSAYQLVLRFDHRISQGVAYEKSLIAEFEVTGIKDSGFNFTTTASLSTTSANNEEDDEDPTCDEDTTCTDWLTSEVFLDIPGGTSSTITNCSIDFTVKPLLSSQTCSDAGRIYPVVMLDNVEIRVIGSECQMQPIDDGQPLQCTPLPQEEDCGGASFNEEGPDYLQTTVLPVEGPDQQDPRNFTFRCVDLAICCQPVGPYLPRKKACTSCQTYERSASESLSCSLSGDLNFDDQVTGADVAILLGEWGLEGEDCLIADINGDGEVNGADLAILLGDWAGCF